MSIHELSKQSHKNRAIVWRQRLDQKFLRAVYAFLQVIYQV